MKVAYHYMNLPNRLTLARFILTMVMIVLAALPPSTTENLLHWKIGFVIGVIAGVTDFLDGYLARKFDLVTDFGKLMDPLVDKIFTVSGFVILVQQGHLPGWVAIVILTREFGVTGLRGMAAAKGEVIAAVPIGKLKTLLQMLTLLLGGFIWVGWLSLDMQLPGINLGLETIWITVYWGVAAITVYSGIDYFIKGRNLYVKEL